jgi:hypothetical protein
MNDNQKDIDKDLNLAQEILERHYDNLEFDAVGIQEVTIIQEGSSSVERADWVVELEELFEKKYGEKKGNLVAQKIMTRLLVKDETVH